jgi:hypothetical protein
MKKIDLQTASIDDLVSIAEEILELKKQQTEVVERLSRALGVSASKVATPKRGAPKRSAPKAERPAKPERRGGRQASPFVTARKAFVRDSIAAMRNLKIPTVAENYKEEKAKAIIELARSADWSARRNTLEKAEQDRFLEFIQNEVHELTGEDFDTFVEKHKLGKKAK